MDLNPFQHLYIKHELQARMMETQAYTPIDLNTDWPSVSEIEESKPVNPEFFRQQELMSEFTKYLKTQESVDLGFGAMGSGSGQAAAVETKSEKVEEVVVAKKEKAVFDLYLNGFDTAKKISMIKEVRALTKLGLKESKDLVEGVPSLILKNVKKEETEEIVKKLESIGGKIELK